MRTAVILLFLFWSTETMVAQNIAIEKDSTQRSNIQALHIGDKVPEAIWKSITKNKHNSLVILDFWNTWCSSCIAAFSKMEHLQRQFKDSLQVVLVNIGETEDDVKIKFDKINARKKGENLKPVVLPLLESVYGDSTLFFLFPHAGVPHHVWLDSTGKVLYITNGENATYEHIAAVIGGKKIWMEEKQDLEIQGYQPLRDHLIKPSLPVLPLLEYSVFMGYHPGIFGSGGFVSDSTDAYTGYITTNTSLLELYREAFHTDRILIELKNKDLIHTIRLEVEGADGYSDDQWKADNLFSYEIKVVSKYKSRTKQINEIRQSIQKDVNAFFEHRYGITGEMENRKIPCLVLVKIKDGLLKTSGKERIDNSIVDGKRVWVNSSLSSIADHFLREALENMEKPIVFLNETGIDNNLQTDMELPINVQDIEPLRIQLRKYGLDILRQEKVAELLILKDKNE